jgi:hypothetical protein
LPRSLNHLLGPLQCHHLPTEQAVDAW